MAGQERQDQRDRQAARFRVAVLWEALDIARVSLRRFVRATLEKQGRNWFAEFVLPALRLQTKGKGRWGKNQWESIEADLTQVEQTGGRVEEILGIRRSYWVIERCWHVFSREFEGEGVDVLRAIRSLSTLRNQAAHGYLDRAMAIEGLDNVLYVLRQIDDDAARQVANLRDEIGDGRRSGRRLGRRSG